MNREIAKRYAGKWVALEGDKVIASGESVKEVMDKSMQKGVKLPLVTMCPSEDEGILIL